MRSALLMLSHAIFTYLVSLGFAAGAVCFATWTLAELPENTRIAAILMRRQVRSASVRRPGRTLARSIIGGIAEAV